MPIYVNRKNVILLFLQHDPHCVQHGLAAVPQIGAVRIKEKVILKTDIHRILRVGYNGVQVLRIKIGLDIT